MFKLFRFGRAQEKPVKPSLAEPYASLIQGFEEERRGHYDYNLKQTETGKRILALDPAEQRAMVMALLEWLNYASPEEYSTTGWTCRAVLLALLRHKIPFAEADLLALIDWSMRKKYSYFDEVSQIISVVTKYLQDHPRTPELEDKLEQLFRTIEAQSYQNTDTRKWVAKLKELSGRDRQQNSLLPGEAWSDAAIAAINSSDPELQRAWIDLLALCLQASSSAPSSKWLKSAAPLIARIGAGNFRQGVLAWFPLFDKTIRGELFDTRTQMRPSELPIDVNADILKGLIWLCSQQDDGEIARALTGLAISAYRKLPGHGPRCVRVGTAAVWSLGRMTGREGIGQLALLKLRVKFGTAQKGIESALAAAAEREGLPAAEIEELSVPSYGMDEVGLRCETIGEYRAEIRVGGTANVETSWIRLDGKRQTSVPQAVKAEHAAELKELAQAAKDIRQMLLAQRDRIENLYLLQKHWPIQVWRERYLDHPLVGVIARRLIWQFHTGSGVVAGIWHSGQIVGNDGQMLDQLDAVTKVSLWHPLEERQETIIAWRDQLAMHEIQQPFKQAYREIYLLTDAERSTRVYSNRFAAHILKQHQFNSLCGIRGWKNKLRLMVDDTYPPAMRIMPEWSLRAEFWVEGAGNNFAVDTTDSGTYRYLSTDQVRFYAIDAPSNAAHAGGGGYYIGRTGDGQIREPLPLEQIPPLVFSEIMRDIDLFVGVASIGNDQNWSDTGPAGRYTRYWVDYAFGTLSETAQTRRQVLERLLPRLKIATRCSLNDRFLVVRGDLRTYKIHLGSSNILIEPDNRYLCIVPARTSADSDQGDRVFLPFEGDNTLAVILSKAFLLADDSKINDPTIVRQIKP